MHMRPYQSTNIEELRDGYRRGIKRQLLVSPTGSGKTVIFAFVTQNAVSKGKRTLILTHRREILDQVSRTLTDVNVDHALIAAGEAMDASKPVQVASVQTLVRRFDEFQKPDLIVIDEAHHSAAGTWAKVFAQYAGAHILGVTATPERLDGKGMADFFDRIVLGPPVQWLIDNGFLAKPIYFAPEHMVDVSGLRKRLGDFATNEAEQLMDKPTITGDAIAHYRKHADGRKAIAFCVTIDHATHVADSFNAAGLRAAVIEGAMTKDDRKQVVDDLKSGAIDVLTSCEIVSEGFDLPAVGAAILLRPTASLAMHLQQVGRSLRPAPGKKNAIILDHVGNCLRHGLVEEAREWTLQGNAAKRRKSEAAAKRCEQCFAIYTGNSCPNCGEVVREGGGREIDEREGNLTQISAEQIAASRSRRFEEAKCMSYEDYAALGKSRGYKTGWAFWRWKTSKKNPNSASANSQLEAIIQSRIRHTSSPRERIKIN